ncbi:hydrolase/acyltransferase [Xylanibacillus composti]|uniref:Hydrolase/acyltransferase n=1 Tax=Xylanibacillus composti TaxID=1572762 RepID=A0A8J4H9H0_9BACL|nr:hydrolase/acyltransferase [Xylanibacillus composti]MDT9723713.1 hydrolase/acyltransferase [Xylanibacillus composti]GIQ71373.1 hypothetical protein XYCOK13_41970 [Xylanibacillus composti]
MAKWKYVLLQDGEQLEFVQMPATHAYQLSALNRRLHKELDKLTVADKPNLPKVLAECESVELHDDHLLLAHGLTYVNELEASFASLQESNYPLISLLTEIRALQAQLEQWYEEDAEGLHE